MSSRFFVEDLLWGVLGRLVSVIYSVSSHRLRHHQSLADLTHADPPILKFGPFSDSHLLSISHIFAPSLSYLIEGPPLVSRLFSPSESRDVQGWGRALDVGLEDQGPPDADPKLPGGCTLRDAARRCKGWQGISEGLQRASKE